MTGPAMFRRLFDRVSCARQVNTLSQNPLASQPAQSRGRQYPVSGSDQRDDFQRDHDRVVHSRAFRKLQHKTQVFVASEIDAHRGDFFRNRLTHSIEVSQITRTICRQLSLNEDLGATIALAHDLGHTPFGHTGEDALSEALAAAGFPAFDHNDQTIRTLCVVESSYPQHPGLNLTWESLEGIAKHNGAILSAPPPAIADLNAHFDLELGQCASLEAQVAAVGDDIAYNSHDIDDGLRAGLFTLDDLAEAVPQVAMWLEDFRTAYPTATLKQCGFQVIRQVIASMVYAVVDDARELLPLAAITTPADFRQRQSPVIVLPPRIEVWLKPLRHFLFTRMYRHQSVMETRAIVGKIVADLYGHFDASPHELPADWAQRFSQQQDPTERSRVLVDYIAGMTDRYALTTHGRLFSNP